MKSNDNFVKVTIYGQEYTIKAPADATYIDEYFAIKRDHDDVKNSVEGKVSSLLEVIEEEIQK